MAKACSGGKSRGGSMGMGGKSSAGRSSPKTLKTPGGVGIRKSSSGPIRPTDRKGVHS